MKSYIKTYWPHLVLSAVVLGAWSLGLFDAAAALGGTPAVVALIGFIGIPSDIRTPGQYVEFDSTRAVQGLPAVFQKILVLGTRLPAGTVAQNIPTMVLSAAQAEGYWGRGSMISHMFQALKKANTYTEVWGIALDENAAGVKATGTITVTGPATEAGTIPLYIAGRVVQVAVASGDAQNAIATAINAAVNANTDLDVVSGVAANVVTLTARHKGTYGNFIDLRTNYFTGEKTPAGVALAIAAMAAGATNPDVATAIAAIGNEQYHTVITGYEDAANLGKVETELVLRFGPLVEKEGQAFVGISGTHGQAVTIGDSRNSFTDTIMNAGKSPTPPWEWAAVTGAIDAFEPDPARPRQTLLLPGILPPAPQDRYTRDERNILLNHGISTFLVDAGGNVLIERLITTYKTNAFGAPDISYLDIETLRTVAYQRFSVRNRIALRFPRVKLANNGTRFGPGQPIVTPNDIRAELLALFREWELAGIAEDFEQFKADLVVERNPNDASRVDSIIPPNLVNQFRIFAGKLQFRL
jgi:phage tail sheath gpL-like